ncbi:hypothetical protein D3C73_752060 [compost metagenome]
MQAEDRNGDFGFPRAGHQHRADNDCQQCEIDPAGNTHFRSIRRGIGNTAKICVALVEITVEEPEQYQQDQCGKDHFRQHMCCGPEEIHAAQITEKQWRIAKRCQRAADVRNEEDEEYDDVDIVPPSIIGSK